MHFIKDFFKKLFGIHFMSGVKPIVHTTYFGSIVHGYTLPTEFLNNQLICYCVGAGIDISFDTALAEYTGAKVFIIDPMPYALDHFNIVKDAALLQQKVTIDPGENEYTYTISKERFSNIHFLPIGVWDKKEIVKFYFPSKENYAGHSITNLQNTDTYIEAPVDTLDSIMQAHQHKEIDILKLEIEGAEYTVLDDIIHKKIPVKIILIEFDEIHNKVGLARLRRVVAASNKLVNAGYTIAHSTFSFKRMFVRNDVYEQLTKK
jgi:FkbM family methyltransferase